MKREFRRMSLYLEQEGFSENVISEDLRENSGKFVYIQIKVFLMAKYHKVKIQVINW